jgi:quercetin dioxygenase-like cupin family protein
MWWNMMTSCRRAEHFYRSAIYPDERSRMPTHPAVTADVAALLAAATGDGAHWTLDEPSDLNVNAVHLDGRSSIATHVNGALDVLIVGMAGSGWVEIDGDRVALEPGTVVHVPKGASRATRAGDDGVGYLTVHLRRGPAQIGRRPAN